MESILAACAIAVAFLTLAYVIWNGNRQSGRLSLQVRALSEQTDRLRRQLSGESRPEEPEGDVQLFLPARNTRAIAAFDGIQKEDQEIVCGDEIAFSRRWETEVHVRFRSGTSQRLALICWGFADGSDGTRYEDRPAIPEYREAFAIHTAGQDERAIRQDWNGYWHMEFASPRLLPRDHCYHLCFTVKGQRPGRFPIEFELFTEEASGPLRQQLWVEITH